MFMFNIYSKTFIPLNAQDILISHETALYLYIFEMLLEYLADVRLF